MLASYRQKGGKMPYTNAGQTDIAYGAVVSLTTRIGVAAVAIAAGADGTLDMEGVFEMPAVNNSAFSQGEALYWDESESELTDTAQGNIPAGYAFVPKAEAGATARVKLQG